MSFSMLTKRHHPHNSLDRFYTYHRQPCIALMFTNNKSTMTILKEVFIRHREEGNEGNGRSGVLTKPKVEFRFCEADRALMEDLQWMS